MKGLLIISALLAVVLVSGCASYTQPESDSGQPQSLPSQDAGEDETPILDDTLGNPRTVPEPTTQKHTVEITSSGFSPAALTINSGDTVTWQNKDSTEHWPASAVHPSHKAYPGSGIQKCGTAEESRIFDACKGISAGGMYSFVFNEIGSWKYHDHRSPSLTGTIVVE